MIKILDQANKYRFRLSIFPINYLIGNIVYPLLHGLNVEWANGGQFSLLRGQNCNGALH
jgi:hypothetical protein